MTAGRFSSRRRWVLVVVATAGCVFVVGYVLLVARHLRLDSADHELDAILLDEGFSATPTSGHLVRLDRRSHCGNPGSDDLPPMVARTLEVPRTEEDRASSELRHALRDAGWRRPPIRHASPDDWHRDFGDFTASLSIHIRGDRYAYVPDGRAWLEVVASVQEPDFCDPW